MTINRSPFASSSKTTTTNHQSTQKSQEDLKRYLPWAMVQQEIEHVSFTSFVEKFKLSHLSRAVGAYEVLIKSTQLKALRRRELSASFKTFKEHSLRSYWLNYKLSSERAVIKINLDIAATKTARIVQDASVGETLKAAELSESSSNYPSIMLSVDDTSSVDNDFTLNAPPNDQSVEPVVGLVGSSASSSTPSLTADTLTACITHPASSPLFGNIRSSKSMKHPRDAFDDEDAGLSKTPRNRCEYNLDNLQDMIFLFSLLIVLAIVCTVLITTSPAPIPTESLGSPPEVYASGQQKNPFRACEDDDEDEEDSTTTDAIGFQTLFTAVKKKTVHIHDIDQALSGVILLNKEGSMIQKLHFGEKTLDQLREKALAKWQDIEATTGRNQVRAWLDTLEDHGYDREKARKHISKNAPPNGSYQKLWAYLVTAIEEFPKSDSSKCYSESTAISSFILPLSRVFMSMPNKRVILNFIDSTTASGRLRNESSSRKEPDLALEIKDRTNKTICEVLGR
ncbi:hypothetical protein BGZ47_006820 [Haplosporangium gracile]|nr:hypothetical protein BGZ47_006820 [Haplosporangium gracile]